MPDNNDDFDLDAWLDGAKRTEHHVTLYARNDLIADIEALERKAAREVAVAEDDRTFDDDSGAATYAQIDALYDDLDKSKLVCRVSYLDDDEVNKIRTDTLDDLKDKLDQATADARERAKAQAKREGLTAPGDINEFIRATARAEASKVAEKEISIRTIAAAIVEPRMSPDQVRALYSKLGDAQMNMLTQAYAKAATQAPEVAVPKSRRPSPDQSSATSS